MLIRRVHSTRAEVRVAVRGLRVRSLALLAAIGLLLSIAASAQDGTADPDFDPQANGYVDAVVVQPDGKILVSGNFTQIGGASRTYLARLNADGTADPSFNVDIDSEVQSIALQPNGAIVFGGYFSTVAGSERNGIARVGANGQLDGGFNPDVGVNGSVHAIVLDPSGKLYIGGTFNAVGATPRASLARLNVDGSLDASFAELDSFNFAVSALILQPDGKLVTGWRFGPDSGTVIIRINADGSQDTSFDATLDDTTFDPALFALAREADGHILVGGRFTVIDGQSRTSLARLQADGSLDANYDAVITNDGGNAIVGALLLKNSGDLYVAGSFDAIGGVAADALARLTSLGHLDPTFDATSSPPNNVADASALAIGADHKLIVGGIFEVIGGLGRNDIARLYDDTIFASGFGD